MHLATLFFYQRLHISTYLCDRSQTNKAQIWSIHIHCIAFDLRSKSTLTSLLWRIHTSFGMCAQWLRLIWLRPSRRFIAYGENRCCLWHDFYVWHSRLHNRGVWIYALLHVFSRLMPYSCGPSGSNTEGPLEYSVTYKTWGCRLLWKIVAC